jgi:hypothetical protein
MSKMLQLDPPIPIHVLEKGRGQAIGWIDYGKEDHLIWIVALDENGQVWLAPNPEVRFLNNYSMGRNYEHD